MDFYVAAAAKKCPEACHCLGRVFAEGLAGVVRSPAMAVYWYKQEYTLLEDAEESRRLRALCDLMTALRQTHDLKAMESLWQKIDWQDNPTWAYRDRLAGLMAEAYLDEPATPATHDKALKCLEKIPADDLSAQRTLWPIQARIYAAGLAVPKDLAKARELYQRAAEFGLSGMWLKMLEMDELMDHQGREEYGYALTYAAEVVGADAALRDQLLAKLKSLPNEQSAELRKHVRLTQARLTEPGKKPQAWMTVEDLKFTHRPFRTARDLNRNGILSRYRQVIKALPD